ncbi:MAG: c-type cytochrome domain-containing protein [Pirellulaceae bacterium]|jgi:WD40 repeat protein|nr:c-type cytochrome domain-containing protein [Pirellulaceae bacterium]MDP7016468.1 c-type cytochrome domain-containing protein [Pirellulaceae bacterium]
MTQRITSVVFLLGFFINAGVVDAADLAPLDMAAAEKISFRGDVWPIVKRHCWGCHSNLDAKGGLNMSSVALMLEGGDSGPLFEAGKPDESLLVEMITGDEPEMPQKQPPMSAAKVDILRGWVLAGARDDSPAKTTERKPVIPDVYQYAPAVTSVSLSPDGKTVAAACRSEVVLLAVESDAPPRRLATASDLLTHVEFSPDGKTLAAAGGMPASFGHVSFFNVATGEIVAARQVGADTLFRGSFAPDGKAIALGGADGAVHIVPVDGKAEVRRFELHSDWVLDAVFSPDGKMIVTAGRDKATKVCSAETGELLRSVDSSTDLVGSVAVDDKFAVSAGRARLPISFELSIALSGVAVSGSGNGSRPVSKRSQYAKNFEGQPGPVLDMAMSGNRKTIAIVGAYGEARLYNVADRKRIGQVAGLPAPLYSAALNRDGSRLCIGSKSGEVRIYQLPDGKLLKSFAPVPVAESAE